MPRADAAAGVALVAVPAAAALLEGVKDGRDAAAVLCGSRGDGTWGFGSLMVQSVTSPLVGAEGLVAVWNSG